MPIPYSLLIFLTVLTTVKFNPNPKFLPYYHSPLALKSLKLHLKLEICT